MSMVMQTVTFATGERRTESLSRSMLNVLSIYHGCWIDTATPRTDKPVRFRWTGACGVHPLRNPNTVYFPFIA